MNHDGKKMAQKSVEGKHPNLRCLKSPMMTKFRIGAGKLEAEYAHVSMLINTNANLLSDTLSQSVLFSSLTPFSFFLGTHTQ